MALSSAEFVCSDICITLNYVHALENICNKIKLYCIDLICSSAYGVRKQTFPINYLTREQLIGCSRKLIKVSECQKREEEVQLSKYWKAESFYVAAAATRPTP